MNEAKYYVKSDNAKVKCVLCPHECFISDGKSGICKVRKARGGILFAETYGKISSLAIDPMEKKPLYHFHPGERILSIGSIGCTFRCTFCQNNEISQCIHFTPEDLNDYSVDDIKTRLEREKLKFLAFTYNEPVVFYEYMLDTARALSSRGKICVMVSNGYINPLPMQELIPYINAFNIDLKSFSEEFYKKLTGGSLKPVLKTLELIKRSGKHLEITMLLIPGENDNLSDFRKMISFIKNNFGRAQVLHISRYFPNYKMKKSPTSLETIHTFLEIAKNELDYVYPGNTGLGNDSNTYCPKCGNLLIQRVNYATSITGLDQNNCKSCKEQIYGTFADND